MDPVGQEDDDIDNDGDVDSSDKYLHARRKAIKKAIKKEEVEELDEISRDTARSYIRKAMAHKTTGETPKKDRSASVNLAGKKAYGIGGKAKVPATESVEQIDELSKKTLSSYTRKAASSMGTAAHDLGQKKAAADEVDRMTNRNMPNKYAVRDQMKKALGADHDAQSKDQNTIGKRLKGIDRATAKLAKEESELEEKLVGGQKKLDHNKNGKIDAHDFHLMRKKKMKEEAEQLDELSPNTLHSYIKKATPDVAARAISAVAPNQSAQTKKHASKLGKRIQGITSASGRLADKANMAENAWEEVPMMMRQLQFIMFATEEIMEYLDTQVDPEEWFQNKLAHIHDQMQTLQAYAEGDMRMMTRMGGMYGEEVELDELKQPSLMQKSKYWLAHGKTPKETARTEKRYAASKSSDTLERLKIGRSSDNVYKPGEKPKDDKSVKFGSPAHMQLKAIDRELKKRQANEEVELDEVTDQERLSARKIQRDAQTARHGIARKPGESMVAYLNRAKKHKEKMQKEEVELDESITKMSHGRLKFHLNTNTPHGSYSNDEMKSERDRRLKAGEGEAYRKAKAGLSEASPAKKAITRALQGMKVQSKDTVSVKKAPWEKNEAVNEVTQSAVKKTVTFTGSDGKSHTRNVPVKRIDRDEHGQEKIRESVELDEAFKVGMLKLNDGGSVILKKEDVDVLNGLFKSLSSTNRKKMESTAMKDKNGFNEILSFAREAI
jgi:hypothetical protein